MPLAYYNTDLVLVKQKAKVANTSFDVQLESSLREAYDYMNSILKRYTTIPLTTSNTLAEIEANIAAGMFKEEATTPVEGERVKKHILRERGEQQLQEYIASEYGPKTTKRAAMFRHGKNYEKMQVNQGDADEDDSQTQNVTYPTFMIYYGESALTSLTEAQIKALRIGTTRTPLGVYVFDAGGYKFIAMPVAAGAPTSFVNQATLLPVGMAPSTVVSMTVLGVTRDYNVYRTLNTLAGAINIVVA